MAARGIPLHHTAADKAALTESDLRRADRRIALKEAEHRPFIRTLFPEWEAQIEYWHVHDLDVRTADEALAEIEAQVIALVHQLVRESGPKRAEAL